MTNTLTDLCGTVTLVESWGSDERIIESARMSTQKGFLGWGNEEKPGDEKLLRYLWENKHSTPFEFAGATFEIEAPIFTFREWHRHRTQSYSEHSARYGKLPELNFIPSFERCLETSNNKQASSTKALTLPEYEGWLYMVEKAYEACEHAYNLGLYCGVPKELARITVPVGRFSKMRASANLRNWIGFLTLRNDSHAQKEIRILAEMVQAELEKLFPRTIQIFRESL